MKKQIRMVSVAEMMGMNHVDLSSKPTVDIYEEYQLIQQKKSKLSATQRRAVVNAYESSQSHTAVLKPVDENWIPAPITEGPVSVVSQNVVPGSEILDHPPGRC